MNEITERTRLPLSLIILILSLAFGVGAAWSQIADLKMKQDTYTSIVLNIDRRLSNIEGKLGVKSE